MEYVVPFLSALTIGATGLVIMETHYSGMTTAKSSDGMEFYVRNRDDKQAAANMLSHLVKTINKFLDRLIEDNPNNEDVKRLVKRWNPESVRESSASSGYTSYSLNKGQTLVFCIRQKDDESRFVDKNTMLFVAIHELAHLMTTEIGHTDVFWNNMKFLLEEAVKQNIYQRVDYKANPMQYCGVTITDSPLDD